MSVTTTKRINRQGIVYLILLAAVILALGLVGCSPPTATDTHSPAARAMPTPTVQTAVGQTRTVRAVPTATPQPAVEPSPTERVAPAAAPQATEAESGVACPAGVVNDPYPGHCKRYVDANNNGLCDLSELGSGDNEPRVRIQ